MGQWSISKVRHTPSSMQQVTTYGTEQNINLPLTALLLGLSPAEDCLGAMSCTGAADAKARMHL